MASGVFTPTFTLTTPLAVGNMGSQITVSAFTLTSMSWAQPAPLAPTGSAQLVVTITETTNGWQQTFNITDTTTIPGLLALNLSNLPVFTLSGSYWQIPISYSYTVQDVMAAAVFQYLVAQSLLPAGTLATHP